MHMSMRVPRGLTFAAGALLASLGAPVVLGSAQAQDAPRAPLVSVRVTPESPGVGEPITIELRVRAPLGSEVRFPALPDSAESIEPLDPRAMREASTATLLDRTAVYRMIAWDTGSKVVRFEDIIVTANGATQRYAVSLPTLRVRSVLPPDSASRVPRAARPPLEIDRGWWRLWVALAVIAGLAFWAWRAWRKRRSDEEPVGPDAALVAEDAFRHAAALGLLDAGEIGRHALVHVGVMRAYLARRFPQANASLTPHEVATALIGADFPVLPERVVDLLLRSEPVAFANAAIDASEARAMADESRAIVRDVETAVRARRGKPHKAAR